MTESDAPEPATLKWRNRLGCLAPAALAFIVLCSGCFMLFAFALTARGELDASILGSDWRVWQLQQKDTNGIGISQTHTFTAQSGRLCQHVRVWLISWRPSLQVEASAYDDCHASQLRPSIVAHERRSAIMLPIGDGP
jgi:hypothetical protein